MDVHDHPPLPPSPRPAALQPTNALAGPSSPPQSQPQPPDPPVFLPPPPAYTVPRPHFGATEDLLARFQLSALYDRYVRPYTLPVGAGALAPEAGGDKGKGKEKEVPAFSTASPAAETPGGGDEGEGDDHPGKVGKKWKNNYKHLIKNIPGKHITKKDDYLQNVMAAEQKQRIMIKPFDLRTQREAFSVSLDGITKWNVTQLIGDSPQVKEEKRRKKELRKLAKTGGVLPSAAMGTPGAAQPATPTLSTVVGTPSAAAWTQQQVAPVRTGTPRPAQLQSTAARRSSTSISAPGQARSPTGTQQRPTQMSSMAQSPPAPQGPATPAATPGAGTGTEAKKSLKREREDSVSPIVGEAGVEVGMVNINTNGATRPPGLGVMNAKAGSGAVRPRPVKKQRMDVQGHAREMPIQQPTPHA